MMRPNTSKSTRQTTRASRKLLHPTMLLLAAIGLLAAALAGCASSKQAEVDSQAWVTPQKTISAAQALGAEDQPQARLYLSYAQEAVKQANEAIDSDNHDYARLALARAQADAQLALTLTQQRQLTQEVQEVNRRIDQLGEQIDGQPSTPAIHQPSIEQQPVDEQFGDPEQHTPDFEPSIEP